jgi:hypothetical protein
VPIQTADLSTTNEHMAQINATLERQQAGIQAAAAEMMREYRETFARMATRQGLTAAEMAETVERTVANAQPTVVDARSVNVDARSVNVDARSVHAMVDARSATVQQMVDDRSVANVINVQGGPPQPSAGAVAAGTKRKETIYPYPFSNAGAPPPKKTQAALADMLAEGSAPPPPSPPPALPAPPVTMPRAKSAPRGRLLAIEDRPARARTRSMRPCRRRGPRRGRPRTRRRCAGTWIACESLEYDRHKAKEASDVAMNRPGRSPLRPRIDPEDLAAAAEAALGKPRAKSRPKASVAGVNAMAEERFGRGRAKAKAAVKKQLKDTIRRVPVEAKKRRPRAKAAAVAAVAAA